MWFEDRELPPPPYDGPFCVIRPEGALYTVTIEPLLPTGEGAPLSYGSKHEAWGAMLSWCQQFGLPLIDFTDGKVGSRT